MRASAPDDVRAAKNDVICISGERTVVSSVLLAASGGLDRSVAAKNIQWSEGNAVMFSKSGRHDLLL